MLFGLIKDDWRLELSSLSSTSKCSLMLVKHHCDLQRDACEAHHLHHQPLFKIPAIRGQTVKAWASHWRRRCSNDAVVDVDADVVQRSVAASGLVVTYDVASSRQRHRVLDDVVAAASSSCDETSATCRQAKVRTIKLLHNLKLLGQRPQCYASIALQNIEVANLLVSQQC